MKIKSAGLAGMMLGLAASPCWAQTSAPAAPGSILGYYDPASGRFTPSDRQPAAETTAYDITVEFTPKFDFYTAQSNMFATVQCTISVKYNGNSFGSATNQYDPKGPIKPFSINVNFQPTPGGGSLLLLDFKCTGVDSAGQQHFWESTDNAYSAVGHKTVGYSDKVSL